MYIKKNSKFKTLIILALHINVTHPMLNLGSSPRNKASNELPWTVNCSQSQLNYCIVILLLQIKFSCFHQIGNLFLLWYKHALVWEWGGAGVRIIQIIQEICIALAFWWPISRRMVQHAKHTSWVLHSLILVLEKEP